MSFKSISVKAMLHEAIFLATCNATNVVLQAGKKKFTCNTPFCNCNCCVASCKKSRTTLYFSQRCETSCLHVTSPQQLATQFFSEWANHSSSFARLARPPSRLLLYALQVAKKVANVWHPLCNLKGFFYPSSLRCKLQEKLLRVSWPSVRTKAIATVTFTIPAPCPENKNSWTDQTISRCFQSEMIKGLNFTMSESRLRCC